MIEQFTSALLQVAAVLIICGVVWTIVCFWHRKDNDFKVSFLHFLGLHSKGFRWDRRFTFIFLGVLAVSVLSSLIQYFFLDGFIEMNKSNASPYWKILKDGLSFGSFIKAIIYCGLQAGLSEEILFRGLIGKALIKKIGLKKGNFIQAIVFWIPHFLLVGMMTNAWFSVLQMIVLLTIFPISLIFGYANERLYGGSILPSWILHGSMNLITFFVLAILLI